MGRPRKGESEGPEVPSFPHSGQTLCCGGTYCTYSGRDIPKGKGLMRKLAGHLVEASQEPRDREREGTKASAPQRGHSQQQGRQGEATRGTRGWVQVLNLGTPLVCEALVVSTVGTVHTLSALSVMWPWCVSVCRFCGRGPCLGGGVGVMTHYTVCVG